MRKLTAVLIALCWFFWVQSLLYASVDATHTIRPGQGIGPISIGMTIDALRATLGPENHTAGDAFHAWKTDTGFLKAWVKDGKVIFVGISQDPQYATDQGLHAGMTRDEVLNVMGKPLQSTMQVTIDWYNDGTADGAPIHGVSVERLYYRGLEAWILNEDLRGAPTGTVWQILVQ